MRFPRTPGRLLAAGTATALLGFAAAPAGAASPVARADGTALVLTVAGSPTDSGKYSASHDGTAQTTSGTNTPVVTLLGGQSLVGVGTLAQNAGTWIDGGAGRSAACAGLAGDGASLAAVGDGNCLSGGQNVRLSAGTFDLSRLDLVASPELPAELQTALAAVPGALAQVTGALGSGVQQALTALGDPGLFLDLGAVQSHCVASPGEARGDASLAGATLYATVPGEGRVDVVNLPVNPPPNTKVVTGLDKVVASVIAALRTQLTAGLPQQLSSTLGAPLADQVLPHLETINRQVVAQVSSQLAPLEKELVDATLNKQTRASAGEIEVTALDLQVLPAAQEFGVNLLQLEVGRSHCGPNGRVAAPKPPSPTPKKRAPQPVPTAVPAGLPGGTAGADTDDHGTGLLAAGGLGTLLLLSAGAGLTALRRSRAR